MVEISSQTKVREGARESEGAVEALSEGEAGERLREFQRVVETEVAVQGEGDEGWRQIEGLVESTAKG